MHYQNILGAVKNSGLMHCFCVTRLVFVSDNPSTNRLQKLSKLPVLLSREALLHIIMEPQLQTVSCLFYLLFFSLLYTIFKVHLHSEGAEKVRLYLAIQILMPLRDSS